MKLQFKKINQYEEYSSNFNSSHYTSHYQIFDRSLSALDKLASEIAREFFSDTIIKKYFIYFENDELDAPVSPGIPLHYNTGYADAYSIIFCYLLELIGPNYELFHIDSNKNFLKMSIIAL